MPSARYRVGLGAAAVLVASHSIATSIDPGVAVTVVVGSPAGACPMGRMDGARTGRSRDRLPAEPRVLWRWSMGCALDASAVAVDRRGAVVVAGSNAAEIAQLGSDGRQQWRAKTGGGVPIAGPVILADDTRLVLTGSGDALGFDANGRARFAANVGPPGKNTRAAPLPLDDGTVALAVGTDVVLLSADGQVQGRYEIGESPTGALVQTAHGVAVTAENGSVYLVRPPARARKVGTFGGDPRPGAAAPDGNTLLAVVDHKRLVRLDVRTGASRSLRAEPSPSLDGPVALDAARSANITTFSGDLTGLSPEGAEVRRTALAAGAPPLPAEPRVIDLSTMSESPPLITDDLGRVGFARVGGPIGVVSPEGSVVLVDQARCAFPVALAPAGRGRMVVACRDGSIVMIGEAKSP